MNRRIRWVRKQQRYKNCVKCGKERAKGSKRLCPIHLEADRNRKRAKQGLRPWVAGKRGRPPLNPTIAPPA